MGTTDKRAKDPPAGGHAHPGRHKLVCCLAVHSLDHSGSSPQAQMSNGDIFLEHVGLGLLMNRSY